MNPILLYAIREHFVTVDSSFPYMSSGVCSDDQLDEQEEAL